jgi:hypothetical protein
MLSQRNHHPRDELIIFEENGHKYKIQGDETYTSVTTWVHNQFEEFNADKIIDKMMSSKKWPKSPYFGKTKEEIKEQWANNASSVTSDGIKLHHDIENFMNQVVNMEKITHADLLECYSKSEPQNHSVEWDYFLRFIKTTPQLVPYRSEWVVFNEDIHICGTVDMVYEKADGTLMIYDWKRCKEITPNGWSKFSTTETLQHIPDSNFWHYALQLNMYKFIIEEKYNKIVSNICLVKLHPNNKTCTYEIIPLPILKKEILDLFSITSI